MFCISNPKSKIFFLFFLQMQFTIVHVIVLTYILKIATFIAFCFKVEIKWEQPGECKDDSNRKLCRYFTLKKGSCAKLNCLERKQLARQGA